MERITHAYCVELGRIVSIDEARIEYLSNEPPRPPKYTYYCAHETCWQKGVRVSAINDHVPLKEGKKFRSPHFSRILPAHPHASGCPWETPEEPIVRKPDESSDEFRTRQARAKLHEIVEVFTPPGHKSTNISSSEDSTASHSSGQDQRRDTGSPSVSSTPGKQSTSLLETLVRSYQEVKKLDWEDRRRIMLNVRGVGSISFVDYFVPLIKSTIHTRDRVIFGRAFLNKSYGEGGEFHFYARPRLPGGKKEEPKLLVRLYVSKEMVMSSPRRHYINEIINQQGEDGYFWIYALGRTEHDPRYKSASLIVSDLKELLIQPGE